MEYDLEMFVGTLRMYMYNLFPYLADRGLNPNGTPKHRDTRQIRDVAFMNNQVMRMADMMTFDIGNEGAEETHPYYHILQQAPTIRKRGKGTKKSKGSEIEKAASQRDFERVNWNGKIFT